MFYIGGLIGGLIAGAMGMAILLVSVLVPRKFGFLHGDRRIWCTAAAAWQIIAGIAMCRAMNADLSDKLEKAFYSFVTVGWTGGATIVWLIAFTSLFWHGKSWTAPRKGIAPFMSVVLTLGGALFLFQLKAVPEKTRQVQADQKQAWIQALKTRDYTTLNFHLSNSVSDANDWEKLKELGSSPLGYAIHQGDEELFCFLLKFTTSTPMSRAKIAGALAAAGDDRMLVSYLEAQSDQETLDACVRGAADYGNTRMLQRALDLGGDPNAKSGYTPLMLAIRDGHLDAVQILLIHGARVNELTDYQSAGLGDTALSQAVFKGHSEIAKLLLEHSADPNLKHENGLSPLMVAKSKEDATMVALLVRSGAN